MSELDNRSINDEINNRFNTVLDEYINDLIYDGLYDECIGSFIKWLEIQYSDNNYFNANILMKYLYNKHISHQMNVPDITRYFNKTVKKRYTEILLDDSK